MSLSLEKVTSSGPALSFFGVTWFNWKSLHWSRSVKQSGIFTFFFFLLFKLESMLCSALAYCGLAMVFWTCADATCLEASNGRGQCSSATLGCFPQNRSFALGPSNKSLTDWHPILISASRLELAEESLKAKLHEGLYGRQEGRKLHSQQLKAYSQAKMPRTVIYPQGFKLEASFSGTSELIIFGGELGSLKGKQLWQVDRTASLASEVLGFFLLCQPQSVWWAPRQIMSPQRFGAKLQGIYYPVGKSLIFGNAYRLLSADCFAFCWLE